jgi:hypothetical protein
MSHVLSSDHNDNVHSSNSNEEEDRHAVESSPPTDTPSLGSSSIHQSNHSNNINTSSHSLRGSSHHSSGGKRGTGRSSTKVRVPAGSKKGSGSGEGKGKSASTASGKERLNAQFTSIRYLLDGSEFLQPPPVAGDSTTRARLDPFGRAAPADAVPAKEEVEAVNHSHPPRNHRQHRPSFRDLIKRHTGESFRDLARRNSDAREAEQAAYRVQSMLGGTDDSGSDGGDDFPAQQQRRRRGSFNFDDVNWGEEETHSDDGFSAATTIRQAANVKIVPLAQRLEKDRKRDDVFFPGDANATDDAISMNPFENSVHGVSGYRRNLLAKLDGEEQHQQQQHRSRAKNLDTINDCDETMATASTKQSASTHSSHGCTLTSPASSTNSANRRSRRPEAAATGMFSPTLNKSFQLPGLSSPAARVKSQRRSSLTMKPHMSSSASSGMDGQEGGADRQRRSGGRRSSLNHVAQNSSPTAAGGGEVPLHPLPRRVGRRSSLSMTPNLHGSSSCASAGLDAAVDELGPKVSPRRARRSSVAPVVTIPWVAR